MTGGEDGGETEGDSGGGSITGGRRDGGVVGEEGRSRAAARRRDGFGRRVNRGRRRSPADGIRSNDNGKPRKLREAVAAASGWLRSLRSARGGGVQSAKAAPSRPATTVTAGSGAIPRRMRRSLPRSPRRRTSRSSSGGFQPADASTRRRIDPAAHLPADRLPPTHLPASASTGRPIYPPTRRRLVSRRKPRDAPHRSPPAPPSPPAARPRSRSARRRRWRGGGGPASGWRWWGSRGW